MLGFRFHAKGGVMKRTTLLCILLLTGCANATKMGRPGQYLIECDGSAVPLGKCYAKAAELCPRGYDVENQERTNGPLTGGAGGGMGAFGSMEHKSIVVQCK
jgi:hypothetical protein